MSLHPVTEHVYLGLGQESEKNDCVMLTPSTFASQREDDLSENEAIETAEIREVVLGCKDKCLGSGTERSRISHAINVQDSQIRVNSSSPDRPLIYEPTVTQSIVDMDNNFINPPVCDKESGRNRNEIPDFISLDTSMTEEGVRDLLFDAGYSTQEINNIVLSKGFVKGDESLNSAAVEESDTEGNAENAYDVLKEIRIKNVNKVVIGTLNINSIASKFDDLRVMIDKNIDILTIQETKLDSSFPTQQFLLNGFSEPYRLDRDRDGGGVLIYVREDIPSKLLTKHTFTKNVEGLFVEVNLRKTKLLFFGGYRSDHPIHGLGKNDYLEQLSFAIDKYSSYDKILLAGDFNIDIEEEIIEDFLFEHDMKSIVSSRCSHDGG